MDSINSKDVLLCADTVVISKNRILGKPTDDAEAIEMLMELSGQWHDVITGVAIGLNSNFSTFSVTSKVKFSRMTFNEIENYVSLFNPLDKAGSYGIQDWIGLAFVERIEGSYTNIVGLPTHEVYAHLRNIKQKMGA